MSTSPIVITPSTSVVLVNTADFSGNPVVLLPNLTSAPGVIGRIITVRDNDGGSVDPTKSIYISTTGGARFQSELSTVTLSTIRITQPYGFVTLTPRLTDGSGNTNYGLMNVYAFPDASPAAYVNTLNANFSYLSTLSTVNLAVGQNAFIQGNLNVTGSINYTNPGSSAFNSGTVNANTISAATILNRTFNGVNIGASTINTSTFVVRDSGSILLPNSSTWSNASAFAGTVDPNSLNIGVPSAGGGAQIGLSSNFFGIRAFTKDSSAITYSTTMVMRDGNVAINPASVADIGVDGNSNFNYRFFVNGSTRMSNQGLNNNIVLLKQTGATGCNFEANTYGGTLGTFRMDTSSNITEGFFGSGTFLNQYKWMSATKAGSIEFFTGTSLTADTSSRMTIDNTGRVGVGTPTPLTQLDVSGVLTIRGSTTASAFNSDSNTYISFAANGASTDWVNLRQVGGSNAIALAYDFYDDPADVRFLLRNAQGTPWEVLRVDNNTSTGSNGTMQVTQQNSAATTTVPALRLQNTSNGHQLNFYTNANAGDWNALVQANDKSIIFHNGTQNTGNLVIAPWSAAGVASGIRMTTEGNVGIGRTPATGYALDVSGRIRLINSGTGSAFIDFSASGGTFSIIRQTGTNGNVDILNNGTGFLSLGTNGSPGRLTINSNGSVGIGTSSQFNSAGKVTIQDDLCIVSGANGSDQGGLISFGIGQYNTASPMSQIKGLLEFIPSTFTETQGGLGFYTRPSSASAGQPMIERMRIRGTSGNLGIGCDPNDSYRLDVSGSARVFNGGIYEQQFSTQTGTANPALQLYNAPTKDRIELFTRLLAAGNYNNIVQISDKAIIFSDNNSYNSNGGFVIAPHSLGTSGIRISSNGSVGIGCNSPSYTLDVAGAGHFTGNLTVDGTITGSVNISFPVYNI